jgi:uncharacterized membrane protein
MLPAFTWRTLGAYIGTMVAMGLLDAIWLGSTAGFYHSQLPGLLLDQPVLWAVALFYPLYALALTIFAVEPALRAGSWKTALIHGALFGFFAYATYDLTNQATLRGWSPVITIVDIGWGVVVSAFASVAGYRTALRQSRGIRAS